jgi:endoglucanase
LLQLVIFELFNEPFPGGGSAKTQDWETWRNGSSTWAGQAQLVRAVRSTGARNVILMGGMAWSNDLSHWLEYAPLELDPLGQSGAVWHSYANNACSHQSCWERTIVPVAQRVPVVVTEMGHGISWAQGELRSDEIGRQE